MNKRGAELSFNMIIIAVLGLLVLVVLGALFLGKLSGVTDSTNKVFSPLSVAQAGCSTNCNSDKLTGSKSYCSAEYSLDADSDGKIDMDGDQVKKYKCNEAPISSICPEVAC